jgi:tRNA(Ile)-lysidine synthase
VSATAQPIDVQEAAALLDGLDRPLAIGVSCGVDSMALLHLVAHWRASGGGAAQPAPLVLTVDHGLRPAAAEEARFVAAAARDLGFGHETLAWSGPKPTTGLQDAARRARYDLLLGRLARDAVPRDLLLAHTLEDQAETLLMRLARGSGIDGLSGMRPVESRVVVSLAHPIREVVVRLRRPLLGVSKDRLTATAAAHGIAWREDPSNLDTRFERVRLRGAGAVLDELGLNPESLARSARRLGQERAALQARTRVIAAAHVHDHGGAYGEFSLPAQHDWQPADIGRILARLVDVYGGVAPAPQLSQIETLVVRILTVSRSALGRLTLGGCLIEIGEQAGGLRQVRIFRECTRAPLPVSTITPGEGIFWDGRFYISVADHAAAAVTVGPFTADRDGAAGCDLPRASLCGLPALVSGSATTLLFGQVLPNIAYRWPPQHAASLHWLEYGDGAPQTI